MKKLKQILKAIYFRIKNYMSLYGVFEKDSSIDPSNPNPKDLAKAHLITIAPSKKDAMAAIDKAIYFNHFAHYKLWCETRDLKIGCREESWIKYKTDVIGRRDYKQEFDQYAVYSMSYSPKNMASFLRVFDKTAPLLMDYEDLGELGMYLTHNSYGNMGIDIPDYLYQLIETDETDGGKIKTVFTMIHDQTKTKEEEKNN